MTCLGIQSAIEPPVHGELFSGILHGCAGQLGHVAQVKVAVGAGHFAQILAKEN